MYEGGCDMLARSLCEHAHRIRITSDIEWATFGTIPIDAPTASRGILVRLEHNLLQRSEGRYQYSPHPPH
jgi:hypothetical protein